MAQCSREAGEETPETAAGQPARAFMVVCLAVLPGLLVLPVGCSLVTRTAPPPGHALAPVQANQQSSTGVTATARRVDLGCTGAGLRTTPESPRRQVRGAGRRPAAGGLLPRQRSEARWPLELLLPAGSWRTIGCEAAHAIPLMGSANDRPITSVVKDCAAVHVFDGGTARPDADAGY